MNFDASLVQPFLGLLSRAIPGLGPSVVAEILATVEDLEPGLNRELRFSMEWMGRPVSVVVRISMDDIDAPDIEFVGLRSVVEEVKTVYDQFCQEHGI